MQLSDIPYGQAVSVEVECLGARPDYGAGYVAKRDGSLSMGGIEVVFTGMRSLTESFTMPELDVVRNHKIDRTCGLHVHIDVRDLDRVQAADVYRQLLKVTSSLKLLVPTSRLSNRYCRWQSNLTAQSRYSAINFHAYSKFNTIEFRMQSGSTERAKIEKWAEVCYQLVQWAKTSTRRSAMTWKNFLSILSADLREWVIRRRVRLHNPDLRTALELHLNGQQATAKMNLTAEQQNVMSGLGLEMLPSPVAFEVAVQLPAQAPRQAANRILGFSVSSVLRCFGRYGVGYSDAMRVLRGAGCSVQPSTVRFMLRTGATNPTGTVAPLTDRQVEGLVSQVTIAF